MNVRLRWSVLCEHRCKSRHCIGGLPPKRKLAGEAQQNDFNSAVTKRTGRLDKPPTARQQLLKNRLITELSHERKRRHQSYQRRKHGRHREHIRPQPGIQHQAVLGQIYEPRFIRIEN